MAPQPQQQKTELSNPDAAVRAANEAREKAEAQLAAAQKKIAELQGAVAVSAPKAKGELPEQYRGTKKYRLRVPHYRAGVYYAAGEVITVTDEKPSRTWVPVEERQVTQVVDVEPSKGRAADQQV